MNPLGVCMIIIDEVFGWLLAAQGILTTVIFVSISSGTFVYISTIEVITEEFSLRRFQSSKFACYLGGIFFVCFIWLIESQFE